MFAPLIRETSKLAEALASHGAKKYVVLLILTDGVIMDTQQTINAIVAATHSPLSIVIVGVGSADFSVCENLHPNHYHV